MTEWRNDEDFLAEVQAALEPVPVSFITAGKAAFEWRNIDAELAALTYDSALDLLAGVRADPAALRSLTFQAAGHCVELEISDDVVHGQLVPGVRGQVELRFLDGRVANHDADTVGYFVVSPVPTDRFRLYCAPPGERPFLTDWIELSP